MKVEWRPAALADRNAIYDYIEADNPRAALTVDTRLWVHAQALARLPALGRPGRIPGTRELAIRRTPYILVYRLVGDTIEILPILHSARRWPTDLADEP